MRPYLLVLALLASLLTGCASARTPMPEASRQSPPEWLRAEVKLTFRGIGSPDEIRQVARDLRANATRVTEINFASQPAYLRDEQLLAMCEFGQLKAISLNGALTLHDQAIAAFLGTQPELERLNLGVSGFGERELKGTVYFPGEEPDAKVIAFYKQFGVGDMTLRALNSLTSLRELKLQRIDLRNSPLQFSRFDRLETMEMLWCQTDATHGDQLAHLPNLRVLNSWGKSLSTYTIAHLDAGFPALEDLTARPIDVEAAGEFWRRTGRLRSLDTTAGDDLTSAIAAQVILSGVPELAIEGRGIDDTIAEETRALMVEGCRLPMRIDFGYSRNLSADGRAALAAVLGPNTSIEYFSLLEDWSGLVGPREPEKR